MDNMSKIVLPYIHQYKDRHGKWRYAFRRGKYKVSLPSPEHKEFSARYDAALNGREWAKPKKHGLGTFGRILEQYYVSPKFTNLKPKTQYEIKLALGRLCKSNEKAILADLTPELVERMQGKMSDRPAMANATMRYFRAFLSYVVKMKIIESNPAGAIEMYKGGEWRSWTVDECVQFEREWPVGTLERRLYALLRYAGQRIGDTVRMSRHDRKNGFISIVQDKTKRRLEIFEHPNITCELDLLPKEQIPFFITEKGARLRADRASKILKAACRKAKLPEDCVAHGLRKRAATDLADSGSSDRDIMAVTGHSTHAMISHYTKDANQKKRSKAAIVRLASYSAKSLKNIEGNNG